MLAIELRLAAEPPLRALGEHGRSLVLLGEAEALARAIEDRTQLVRVLTEMAAILRVTGDFDGAMAAGQQALALAVELDDSALQARAAHYLGQAYHAIGDFGRAAELLQRNVEATDRASGALSTDLLIQSQAWLSRTFSALGAFAAGRRHGEEALRRAMLESRGDTLIIAYTSLGYLYLAKGDLEHTIRVLEPGLALCRASGHRINLRTVAAGLGCAYALQGRLAAGHALLEEAIREGISTGALQNRSLWVAWLSEVCRLAGRHQEAWQHARQACNLARQYKERANEALARHQLGVVHAHADPPNTAQAEAYYQQALALAEELGMRPLQAHCHYGLGRLYGQAGQRQPAHAELSAALTMYHGMDMTFWLPQAEAALAQMEG
jgi:tetratricopeptide (TPR) repeat protein